MLYIIFFPIQGFMFWTATGENNGIHISVKETGDPVRGVLHLGNASDIVVLDSESQPLIQSK
jgi:hypothetical protein